MKTLPIVLSFVLFVSLMNFVSAAPFQMNVIPNSVSLCQCSSITPENVKVSIKNLYEYPDTYTFTMDVPEGWRYQIQLNAALNPGEEKELDLFLINIDCCVVPGTYTATLTAVSGLTGESVSKNIQIEILNCYDVELKTEKKYQRVCEERKEPAVYKVDVTNRGKFKETFELSSDKEWVVFSQNLVTLDSGETKTIKVTVQPPEDLRGMRTVNVYAKSTYSYAQDSETLAIDVQSCYNFTANLQPKTQSICLGESAGYTLVVGNLGSEPDTYKIYAPNWITLKANSISLGGNSAGETELLITPTEEGKRKFNLTVISTNNPDLSATVEGEIITEDCSGVDIAAEPVEIHTCKETPETVEFVVTVKNTGKIKDTFKLYASDGMLNGNKTFLKPGDSKDFVLTVNTMGLENPKIITVTVSDKKVSKNVSVRIVPETCYSAEVSIEPVNESVCLCSSASYRVTVKNTGKIKDNYTLMFESEFLNQTVPGFGLEAGESKTLTFGFNIPLRAKPGVYPVNVKLVSEHVLREANASLLIKEKEECYGVDIVLEEKVEGITTMAERKYLQECEAVTVPVTLKNWGPKNDTYTLVIEGPEWVYITPNVTNIESGKEETVYLYISPPFDSAGKYAVNITASSFYAKNTAQLKFEVVKNVTEVKAQTSVNASVSKNQTQTNISGAAQENITGLIIGTQGIGWKVLAVIVITLIIIIILVVRFIFLVKK